MNQQKTYSNLVIDFDSVQDYQKSLERDQKNTRKHRGNQIHGLNSQLVLGTLLDPIAKNHHLTLLSQHSKSDIAKDLWNYCVSYEKLFAPISFTRSNPELEGISRYFADRDLQNTLFLSLNHEMIETLSKSSIPTCYLKTGIFPEDVKCATHNITRWSDLYELLENKRTKSNNHISSMTEEPAGDFLVGSPRAIGKVCVMNPGILERYPSKVYVGGNLQETMKRLVLCPENLECTYLAVSFDPFELCQISNLSNKIETYHLSDGTQDHYDYIPTYQKKITSK